MWKEGRVGFNVRYKVVEWGCGVWKDGAGVNALRAGSGGKDECAVEEESGMVDREDWTAERMEDMVSHGKRRGMRVGGDIELR